jgi:HSP90 family molecular chaperone
MSIEEILKKIWNLIKIPINLIQNYMKTQWQSWDKQAEEEEKRGEEQQQVQKEKDLYDRYEEEIWGEKKSKKKK